MKAKFDDINEQLHKEAMTDSIAAARERLATLIYKTKPFLTGRQAKEIADAILAAEARVRDKIEVDNTLRQGADYSPCHAPTQSAMNEARGLMTDDELLALARRATPGEWRIGTRMPSRVYASTSAMIADCDRNHTNHDQNEHDAAYIAAANPSAIIALIERHRAEVDGNGALLNDYINANARLTRERDEARQENQYLRDEKAVLDTAIKCAHSDELTAVAMQQNAEHLRDVAEAALSAAQKRIAELEGVVRQAVDEKDGPEPPHALGSEWHDRARAALAGKEDGGSPSPLIRSQQGG